MRFKSRKHQRGFTLLELLITLAIVGVTLKIGMPSFESMIVSNRLTSASNEMMTALHYARSEALKRVSVIGVQISESAGTWDVYDPGDGSIIQKYAAPKNVTLQVSGSSDKLRPRFRPDGRLVDVSSVVVVFKSAISSEQRTLTIQLSGKFSVTNP